MKNRLAVQCRPATGDAAPARCRLWCTRYRCGARRGGYLTGANSGASPVTALPVLPQMGGETGSRAAAALLLAAGQSGQAGDRTLGRVSCAEPVPAIAAKLQFMGIPDPNCAICSISLHKSAFRLTGKDFIIRFLENRFLIFTSRWPGRGGALRLAASQCGGRQRATG